MANSPHRTAHVDPGPMSLRWVIAGAAGVMVYVAALWALRPWQFNVVNYGVERFAPACWLPMIFALCVVMAVLIAALWTRRGGGANHTGGLGCLWPLWLAAAALALRIFFATPPFVTSFLMILGAGGAAFLTGSRPGLRGPVTTSATAWGGRYRVHVLAPGIVVSAIAVLTIVHTRIQINFFEHFMLGHADIGHFIEELKNALAGRGLRSDSFETTRLGWHFVPLLYALVPGYALCPSPVYLMVCGAIFLHLPALLIYILARRMSGSPPVGLMWAGAWLLLPSISRMVYGNTYGFAWNHVTILLIVLLILLSAGRRWTLVAATAVILLLCRETASAAVLGWGVYLMCFERRRALGLGLAIAAVAYFLLCAYVLIPHFSPTGRFERLALYGELGDSVGGLLGAAVTNPVLFFGRLARAEAMYFLMILIVPLALLPLAGWRMSLAAVPALVPILLFDNSDWLSIKFWHQGAALPFLFCAGLIVTADAHRVNLILERFVCRLTRPESTRPPNIASGAAFCVLVCAAMGHYFYGFSPLSKPYEVYASTGFLHTQDPRLAAVRLLREQIPRQRSILATERLAAHFTDYRRLYTGRRKGALDGADYVVIDQSDQWDTSGLPQRAEAIAAHPDFEPRDRFGSIVVFRRRPDASSTPLD